MLKEFFFWLNMSTFLFFGIGIAFAGVKISEAGSDGRIFIIIMVGLLAVHFVSTVIHTTMEERCEINNWLKKHFGICAK